MKFMRAAGCSFLGVLALVLAQCDTGETPEPVVNLPFALLAQRSSGNSYTIVLIRTDRTVSDLAEGLSPRWSPSGNQVAFWTTTMAGVNEIFIVNGDGTDLRNLTNTPPDIRIQTCMVS